MIELKRISYSYEKSPILKNISLQIRETEFLAIIGANGSGKTTLVKHLNGLLLPTMGDVFVDGISTKKDSWNIKQKIGIVFQNPEDQLIQSIVEEDVAFGLENLGIRHEVMVKKVSKVLKTLHIGHLAKRNVNDLSFGQKQLVALAGVLAMEPKYIIFDEPTTMLDPKNKAMIMEWMHLLNKNGKAIILVTNNLDDIKRFVQRVVLLKDGKVVFNGKKEKLTKALLQKADMHG